MFNNKSFVCVWISALVSNTAAYFSFIAMPWLVLSMTDNSPLHMSMMVAVGGIPHSLFVLFGGAVSDRFSALNTLIVTKLLLSTAMLTLASLLYFITPPLWLLYLFAFLMGTLAALSLPANQSILPMIVSEKYLVKANAFVMSTVQIAQIFGPALAGWAIWLARESTGMKSESGDLVVFSIAFFVESLLIFTALMLLFGVNQKKPPVKSVSSPILSSVLDGVKYCWSDLGMRYVLCYLVLVSFCMHGPLLALLPIIIKVKFSLLESDYGSLYSLVGVGVIVGAWMSVKLSVSAKHLGLAVLVCDLFSGLGFVFLGMAESVWNAAPALLLMGTCSGFIMVAGTSWFQRRTDSRYMGRVMGLLMFSMSGLIPISATLTGTAMTYLTIDNITTICGFTISLLAVLGLLIPRIRRMGRLPSNNEFDLDKFRIA